jgi:YHS domain-containing protein
MDGVIEAAGGRPRRGNRTPAPAVKLQRDPVCGTFVAPATALSLTSGGSTLYFCSDRCRSEYQRR